jgi:hypothetical protein
MPIAGFLQAFAPEKKLRLFGPPKTHIGGHSYDSHTSRLGCAGYGSTPLYRSSYYAPTTTYYAPTTTYYAPTTTYYAPAVPTVSYYSPAPTVTYYSPAPTVSYYAPTTYVAPAYYRPLYVPGQPVRNAFRSRYW